MRRVSWALSVAMMVAAGCGEGEPVSDVDRNASSFGDIPGVWVNKPLLPAYDCTKTKHRKSPTEYTISYSCSLIGNLFGPKNSYGQSAQFIPFASKVKEIPEEKVVNYCRQQNSSVQDCLDEKELIIYPVESEEWRLAHGLERLGFVDWAANLPSTDDKPPVKVNTDVFNAEIVQILAKLNEIETCTQWKVGSVNNLIPTARTGLAFFCGDNTVNDRPAVAPVVNESGVGKTYTLEGMHLFFYLHQNGYVEVASARLQDGQQLFQAAPLEKVTYDETLESIEDQEWRLASVLRAMGLTAARLPNGATEINSAVDTLLSKLNTKREYLLKMDDYKNGNYPELSSCSSWAVAAPMSLISASQKPGAVSAFGIVCVDDNLSWPKASGGMGCDWVGFVNEAPSFLICGGTDGNCPATARVIIHNIRSSGTANLSSINWSSGGSNGDVAIPAGGSLIFSVPEVRGAVRLNFKVTVDGTKHTTPSPFYGLVNTGCAG